MNPSHPLYLRDLDEALGALPDARTLEGATVLVTGATGMVGSCVTDLLARLSQRDRLHLKIVALCRDAGRAAQRFAHLREVEPVSGDMTGAGELPGADFVVHAASNAHPMAFSTDPVGTMKANLVGTMRLLERLRDCGGRRLLFVSTGESKRAAETLCASYARQYGLDAVVARLCYVYGPTVADANSRADAQFLRRALAGQDIVLKSDGAQLRSYCYVADAAAALLTILLAGERGLAYNVANRDSVHTIRQYAETLARLAGVKVTFDLPPETERQGYSTVSRAVQNSARLEALGWSARHTLEDGLRHTLDILQNQPDRSNPA